MTRTIAFLYDTHDDAAATVRDLEASLPHDDISIVAGDGAVTKGADVAQGAGTGATIGAVVGGGAGLLAGLGMLTIPGIGPVVAAGWLAASVAGAAAGGAVGGATGGIIGSLTEAGVSTDHAHVYAEGIRRGGTLVTVRVDNSRANEAPGILLDFNAVDPDICG